MVVRVKTFRATGSFDQLELAVNSFLSTLSSLNVLDVVMGSAGTTSQGMQWFAYVTYREE